MGGADNPYGLATPKRFAPPNDDRRRRCPEDTPADAPGRPRHG